MAATSAIIAERVGRQLENHIVAIALHGQARAAIVVQRLIVEPAVLDWHRQHDYQSHKQPIPTHTLPLKGPD
ncbi:hypothetical protein ACFJIW_04130 [Tahibacter sp. UC22_41]|uniref:hypothetical protein n=1 Tax=Tahibacter sp. UC22_41 TaxID=3350178 RepID=UPI0036D9014F